MSENKASGKSMAERLRAERWFHAIDFGEVAVYSAFHGDRRPNVHLYPVFEFLSELNLLGADTCDLGTFDGLTAFVMERMGARSVEAICQYDLKRFRLAKEALGADKVNYIPESQAEDMLARFGEAQFDVIVVSATLHHFTSPQEALFICRRLLRPGGYLVLEALVRDGDDPELFLNTELPQPVFGNPTVWVSSLNGLRGMVRLAAFDPIASIELTGLPLADLHGCRRYTHLCEALPPQHISGRSAKLAEIQDTARWTGRIDFKALAAQADGGDWSDVHYRGPTGHRTLNGRTHVSPAPLQPEWLDDNPARGADQRWFGEGDLTTLMDVAYFRRPTVAEWYAATGLSDDPLFAAACLSVAAALREKGCFSVINRTERLAPYLSLHLPQGYETGLDETASEVDAVVAVHRQAAALASVVSSLDRLPDAGGWVMETHLVEAGDANSTARRVRDAHLQAGLAVADNLCDVPEGQRGVVLTLSRVR